MDKIKVVIRYENELKSITVDDNSMDIHAIKNLSMEDWFAASKNRSGWKGLKAQIFDMIEDDEAELVFQFIGPEKVKKDFSGKRKNGAARPSKKDRLALKQQKEFQEAQSIANEIFGSIPKQSDLYFKPKTQIPGIPPMSELPLEKQMMLKTAFTEESKGYSAYDLKSSSEFIKPKAMISEAPKPASGRVLKASFGAKTGDKPKAVIVSAADHAKQKAEERAKKIQDFFKAKHPEATVMPDGTPVKRGRGRPRKNPVV